MSPFPYHQYLFFQLDAAFYQLPTAEQDIQKQEFGKLLGSDDRLRIAMYATRGLKVGTTFMLWCQGAELGEIQQRVQALFRTKLGSSLTLSYTYFGMIRDSEYSGRSSNSTQEIHPYEDRKPFLVVYPFTKTTEWHQLDADTRKTIMSEHIQVGRGHPNIKQCLLYSYGVDDQEFIVSYEMEKLEEFQTLVIEMRRTKSRIYTLRDTPTFTCLHQKLDEFLAWL